MRIFFGIVLGIVTAFVLQAGTDVISNLIYPASINDMLDRQQVSEAFANRPTGALALAVLGFFLAGLGGGYVAKLVSRRGWTVWVPAGLFVLMALALILAYPLPAWTWFGFVAGPLIGGLLARHIGADPEPAPQPETPSDAGL